MAIDRTALYIASVALFTRIAMSVVTNLAGPTWLNGLPVPPLYGDFSTLFLGQLHFLAQGYLPYRDFGYYYGPLFLYSLLPFYVISSHLAAVPIILADSLTAPLIYVLVRKYSSQRIAILSALGYALSPFALVNEGVIWSSSQPMTFMLLLSYQRLEQKHPVSSAAILGLSILFKQESLFVLPAYAFVIWMDYRNDLIQVVEALAVTITAISAPFLILAPGQYVGSISNSFLPGYSLPKLSIVTVGATSVAAQPCQVSTFPGLFTGAVCGSIFNFGEFTQNLFWARVELLASVLEPMLVVVFTIALWEVRHSPKLPLLGGAFSLVAFLEIFGRTVHVSLGYYFLPVYALLCASATNSKTLAAAVTALVVSTFLPEGTFQLLPPLLAAFTIAAWTRNSVSDAETRL